MTTNFELKFDNIIGHEDVKEALRDCLLPKILYADKCAEFNKLIGSKSSSSILLYGLPGVGKSMFLNSISEAFKDNPDVDVVLYKQHQFMSHQIGKSSKMICDIFSKARNTKKKLYIILLDEADGILETRGSKSYAKERTDAFISELDGVEDSSKVCIIATTNFLDHIDVAIQSRFETIEVFPPTPEEHIKFIERYLSPLVFVEGIEPKVILQYTNGFTGRNYEQIARKLYGKQLRKGAINLVELSLEVGKYQHRAGIIKNKYDYSTV